jgi:hypothetical protein
MEELTVVERTWIRFEFQGKSPSGKTQIWIVITKEGGYNNVLGCIKWHGPWRKYCFFPAHDTLYETVCLTEIAQFLKKLATTRLSQKRINRPPHKSFKTSAALRRTCGFNPHPRKGEVKKD